MKQLLKKSALVFLIMTMVLLTGCDELDYRKAVLHYNAGEFSQAAELFAQIPQHEDSARLYDQARYYQALELYNAEEFSQAAELFAQIPQHADSALLHTRCGYNLAVRAMESGEFADAVSQFDALEDFEDARERSLECRYQLALAAFAAEDFDSAQTQFAQLEDYRMSGDYLRQIGWERFYRWLLSAGQATDDGAALQTGQDDLVITLTAHAGQPRQISISAAQTRDEGYVFTDSLTLLLPREDAYAAFTAESTFAMELKGMTVGTTQQGIGRLELATCTGETLLRLESYTKSGTDHFGNPISSQEPADSTMQAGMQENLQALLEQLPQLLQQHEAPVTLADLGFPQ